LGAALVVALLAVAACGADDGGGAALAGAVREPAPRVDGTTLPSLVHEGEDVEFRARPGGLEVVYFGYTSCPDVCPTTMADLAVALRKLPDEQAEMVDVVMVTIDPDRDLDVLGGYVRSFVPEADAAGTADGARLASAAEAFGVVYSVATLDDGEVEVEHSPFLYVVNDEGELVLSWQFGETSDNMAADLATLLERDGGAA
jgi:protein SCO1/2